MHLMFEKDYNYMPLTYKYPIQLNDFEKDYEDITEISAADLNLFGQTKEIKKNLQEAFDKSTYEEQQKMLKKLNEMDSALTEGINLKPNPDEEKEEDQELEATLKKAQERNDEHEAEKKARMRKAPLPPNERDW